MSRIQKRQVKSNPGSFELVDLDTMKEYLLETNDDRDNTITNLILAATSYLEAELDYAIDTDESISQYYDGFSSVLYIWHRYIQDTISVEYLKDGDWVEVDDSVYRLDRSSSLPRVILRVDQEWPTDGDTEDANVRVSFTPNTDHPAFNAFRQVIKEYVAMNYEQPEGSWNSSIMVSGIMRIIWVHKLWP